jgi:predicted nucleic acid-binding Zn ribbon protein
MDSGGARVAAAWNEVAGSELAEETRVSRFRRGVVYIEVASPPLCSELSQFRAMELLQSMRTKLEDEPPIKELRFRLGTF